MYASNPVLGQWVSKVNERLLEWCVGEQSQGLAFSNWLPLCLFSMYILYEPCVRLNIGFGYLNQYLVRCCRSSPFMIYFKMLLWKWE